MKRTAAPTKPTKPDAREPAPAPRESTAGHGTDPAGDDLPIAPLAEFSDPPPRVYCFGCGYDLESVTIGGECPECGESVNVSVAHARATTRRQAVAIVLRLAAILLIFLILTNPGLLEMLTMMLAGWMRQLEVSTVDQWWDYLFWTTLPLGLRLAVSVTLWVTAPWLAKLIVPVDGKLIGNSDVTRREALAMALVFLGVVLIVWGISDTINGWSYLLARDMPIYLGVPEPGGWAVGLIRFVAGVGLVTSARLRGWLTRYV